MTFDELIAPMPKTVFLEEYLDRKHIVLRGAPDRFSNVLPWNDIERLVDMRGIWSERNLRMFLDGQPIRWEDYCTQQRRSSEQRPIPEPERVRYWVARGASIVLNGVDTFTPGLGSVNAALEQAGLGGCWANVYISWPGHPALPLHRDSSDVFVVQVDGSKTWNIWEARDTWPSPHPAFKMPPLEQLIAQRGKLLEQVTLRQGDLLYLPHGQFHEALAETTHSVHVTYGVWRPTPFDLLRQLMERAELETPLRKPFPVRDGSAESMAALKAAVEDAAVHVSQLFKSAGLWAEFEHLIEKKLGTRASGANLQSIGMAGSKHSDAMAPKNQNRTP
jgi:ribosomal protein L16 Arg81 hydroxylase